MTGESGTFYMICGMAGAGKTTLARSKEHELGAVRLSPDEWLEPMLVDVGDFAEMNRLREVVHGLQWSLAQRLLELGNDVICEQGFWGKEERLDYLQAARETGARVVLHYLDVGIVELKRRVSERNADLPKGSFFIDPDALDVWMTRFEPPELAEQALFDEFVKHPSE